MRKSERSMVLTDVEGRDTFGITMSVRWLAAPSSTGRGRSAGKGKSVCCVMACLCLSYWREHSLTQAAKKWVEEGVWPCAKYARMNSGLAPAVLHLLCQSSGKDAARQTFDFGSSQ